MEPTQSHLWDVAENAGRHLHSRLHGFGSQISCDYRDGVLYLRGQSRNFYHKQLAQEIVRTVDGVVRVVNEIEVVADSAWSPPKASWRR